MVIKEGCNGKGRWAYWLLITVTLLFSIWLAGQIPYTNDDWDWGVETGLQHLITADINSRYAGNLIVVLLTRSTILKTIVMGIVLAVIPAVCTHLALLCMEDNDGEKCPLSIQICCYLFSGVILLSLPSDTWRQTHGWVSGFSNYVVSGLALLLYFCVIAVSTGARLPASGSDRHRNLRVSVALLFFGIVIQLFIENLTVVLFLYSLFFAFYCLKNKKNRHIALSLLIGTTIGLFVMFSSSVYQTLWDTGTAVNDYRQLMYDRTQPIYVFLKKAAYWYFRDLVPRTVSLHCLLAFSISALFFLSGVSEIRQRQAGKPYGAKYLILSTLNFAYSLYYLFCFFSGSTLSVASIRHLDVIVDNLFVCLVTCEIYLLFSSDKRLLLWLYVMWGSAFFILAPMLVSHAVLARSYYAPHLCMIVFCQILLVNLLRKTKHNVPVLVLAGLLAVFLLFGIGRVRIYYPIGVASRQRYEVIRQAKANRDTEILIPQYPCRQYLWGTDPKNDFRIRFYKEFYEIPEDTLLYFESLM